MQKVADGGEHEDANAPFEVYAENWDAVRVWHRCEPNWIGTFAGMFSRGVQAQEVRTVALALRVKFDADLLDKVRHMAAYADTIRNRK